MPAKKKLTPETQESPENNAQVEETHEAGDGVEDIDENDRSERWVNQYPGKVPAEGSTCAPAEEAALILLGRGPKMATQKSGQMYGGAKKRTN